MRFIILLLTIVFFNTSWCCADEEKEEALKQALDTLMMGRYSGFKAGYEEQCRKKQRPNEHFKENLIERLDGMVMRLTLRLELEKEMELRNMLDKMLNDGTRMGASLEQQDLGLVDGTEAATKEKMIEANCGEGSAYTLAYQHCLKMLGEYEKVYAGYLKGE